MKRYMDDAWILFQLELQLQLVTSFNFSN